MHYQYLPVQMPGSTILLLPPNLGFIRPMVERIRWDSFRRGFMDPYIYVTAKRRFASPDNPLNRPGWHCDGFGTDDLNYVWMDKWGSRVALQDFTNIDPSHARSMENFEAQIKGWDILSPMMIYRLSPYVVHNTPLIPDAGGMRSFIKISVSNYPYNLIGNSHNHLFDYDWKMYPRSDVRNDPTYGGADFFRSPNG